MLIGFISLPVLVHSQLLRGEHFKHNPTRAGSSLSETAHGGDDDRKESGVAAGVSVEPDKWGILSTLQTSRQNRKSGPRELDTPVHEYSDL